MDTSVCQTGGGGREFVPPNSKLFSFYFKEIAVDLSNGSVYIFHAASIPHGTTPQLNIDILEPKRISLIFYRSVVVCFVSYTQMSAVARRLSFLNIWISFVFRHRGLMRENHGKEKPREIPQTSPNVLGIKHQIARALGITSALLHIELSGDLARQQDIQKLRLKIIKIRDELDAM